MQFYAGILISCFMLSTLELLVQVEPPVAVVDLLDIPGYKLT